MVTEINKENGNERMITLDEAVTRLKSYYGIDVKSTLLQIGLMQTSFFYYEIKLKGGSENGISQQA